MDVLKVVFIFLTLLLCVFGNDYGCGKSPSYQRYSDIFDDAQSVHKVLAGDNSEEGQWPWLISVWLLSHKSCTGTIIGDRWVVTAAHCIAHFNGLVGFGSVDLKKQKTVKADAFIHPSYKKKPQKYDIALLKLHEKLEFNKDVQPICLSKKLGLQKHEVVAVAGWGAIVNYVKIKLEKETDISNNRTLFDYSSPDILQERHQTIIALNECGFHLFNGTEGKNREGEVICVGGYSSGIFRGDSGGPLMTRRDGQWFLAGVAKSGTLIGQKSRIDVGSYCNYLELSQFCDFIESTTSGEVKCKDNTELSLMDIRIMV